MKSIPEMTITEITKVTLHYNIINDVQLVLDILRRYNNAVIKKKSNLVHNFSGTHFIRLLLDFFTIHYKEKKKIHMKENK